MMDKEHSDFENVTRYKCKWCNKDFKTVTRHNCKYKPQLKSCFSCNSCKGVEYIRLKDGASLSEREVGNSEYEKRFICEKKYDIDGKEGIRTIWKLAQKRWDAGCPGYEMIAGYAGKDTYLERIVYSHQLENASF